MDLAKKQKREHPLLPLRSTVPFKVIGLVFVVVVFVNEVVGNEETEIATKLSNTKR